MRLATLTLALVAVADARTVSWSGRSCAVRATNAPTMFSDNWGRKSIAFSGVAVPGRAPAGGQDVEAVFRSFSYQP